MNQSTSIKQFFTVRRLVLVGLMAALVFVFTFIGFDIPSPLGKAKLHLGNVMCLLSGLLFGPLTGGLAARHRQRHLRFDGPRLGAGVLDYVYQ